METTAPIKNVAYVCATVIDELAGGDLSDMLWMQRTAYRCISEELPAKTSYPCVKVAHLNLNSINQAALPADYVRYTKIAVDLGGKLWTLSLDNNITLPTNLAKCTSNVSVTDQSQQGGVWFAPYYTSGFYYGAQFSLGGGFNESYYRIDEENKLIQFLGDVPRGGKLVLEYLSNNLEANDGTMIPALYIPVLRWYLIWKACEKFPKKYKTYLTNPREEYEMAKTDAAVAGGSTPEEILDGYWAGSGFLLR
jgi:hypothetical protein